METIKDGLPSLDIALQLKQEPTLEDINSGELVNDCCTHRARNGRCDVGLIGRMIALQPVCNLLANKKLKGILLESCNQLGAINLKRRMPTRIHGARLAEVILFSGVILLHS